MEINPALQESAAKWLTDLHSYASTAANWAAQEVPSILQDFLKMLFIEKSIYAGESLLILLVLLLAIGYCYYKTDGDDGYTFLGWILGALALIPFFVGVNLAIDAIQIKYSPKAYLIKYVIEETTHRDRN